MFSKTMFPWTSPIGRASGWSPTAGSVSRSSYVETTFGRIDRYAEYAAAMRCTAANIVGTKPTNTTNPAKVKPKFDPNATPAISTSTVLTAIRTLALVVAALVQIVIAAMLFAAANDAP